MFLLRGRTISLILKTRIERKMVKIKRNDAVSLPQIRANLSKKFSKITNETVLKVVIFGRNP